MHNIQNNTEINKATLENKLKMNQNNQNHQPPQMKQLMTQFPDLNNMNNMKSWWVGFFIHVHMCLIFLFSLFIQSWCLVLKSAICATT